MPIVTSRRSFLSGLAGLLISAPAVIAYDKLMPVKLFVPSAEVALPVVEVDSQITSVVSGVSNYTSGTATIVAEVDGWGYSQNPILHTKVLIEAIKKEVRNASESVLFEVNDTFTRDNYKTRIHSFLAGIQAERKIADFSVVCDNTNNGPTISNDGAFFASIYVKPTTSTSFIRIDSIVQSQGPQFFPIRA